MRQRGTAAADRIVAERGPGLRGPKSAPRLAPAKATAAAPTTAVAARAGHESETALLDPDALARSPFVDLDTPLTAREGVRVRDVGLRRVGSG